jgi:hypothetical protein
MLSSAFSGILGALRVQGYCDASMVGDLDTHKPTSRYVYTIASGKVSCLQVVTCLILAKHIGTKSSAFPGSLRVRTESVYDTGRVH